MPNLSFIAYGVGGFLTLDALGNLTTAGHNSALEFIISANLLFAGAMLHLIKKFI